MNNELILVCPHCNKPIKESDIQHNDKSWANVEKYLESQKQILKANLQRDLNLEYQKEFDNKFKIKELEFDKKIVEIKLELDKNSQEELNKKEILINNFKNQIANLEKEQELIISKKEAELKNSIQNEISKLEQQLMNKDFEIKTTAMEFENKLSISKNEIEKKYATQIEELKIANAQNKILQSKRKGENFEHEVEGELRKAFGLYDSIEKINNTTNDKKADYLQVIKNATGKEIGKIVYEVKNAEWKDTWENKLAIDVANNKTKYGILIATSFNERYNGIPFIKSEINPNIWITDSESFVFVGQIVRRLIEIENDYTIKTQILTNTNSQELIKEYEIKKQKLDQYWTIEFPKTYKIIKTELEAIDSVKVSLTKNADKLAKASNRLNAQFKDKVKQGLAKILGELILEETEEK
ncbi:DUF2130 domain-containing protein [Mesoplasma photuris]|uniref:DUF2130 domain-containing protein n=1 Tax=Mesoplasma photuris TaxID=217731 RepID=UPI0004E1B45B|nr:DUF2130 domain-containing protein [Mesoplasma photuris]